MRGCSQHYWRANVNGVNSMLLLACITTRRRCCRLAFFILSVHSLVCLPAPATCRVSALSLLLICALPPCTRLFPEHDAAAGRNFALAIRFIWQLRYPAITMSVPLAFLPCRLTPCHTGRRGFIERATSPLYATVLPFAIARLRRLPAATCGGRGRTVLPVTPSISSFCCFLRVYSALARWRLSLPAGAALRRLHVRTLLVGTLRR